MNQPTKCNDCLDSGWLLHIMFPTGQQGFIAPDSDHQTPKNAIKTFIPCKCEVGKDRIIDKNAN